MLISFIGAGKVANSFSRYLKTKGINTEYFYSRNKDAAQAAADEVACQATEDLVTLVNQSNMIFITTKDDVISNLVHKIHGLGLDLRDKAFVHMSGALTSEVLLPLKGQGASVYSLHPLQTFANKHTDMAGIYFSLETEDNPEPLEGLIKTLGNPYFKLMKDQKVIYHLSACIFSNYLVTLMDFGKRMLEGIGIEGDQALKAMDPLVMKTYANIQKLGTQEALTGPIQRGDLETIEKHMLALSGKDLALYKELGQATGEHLVTDDIQDHLKQLWKGQKDA